MPGIIKNVKKKKIQKLNMKHKRLQSVTHPPSVIGQNAPEVIMANMSLTSLQSAAQLSLLPRCIEAHTHTHTHGAECRQNY